MSGEGEFINANTSSMSGEGEFTDSESTDDSIPFILARCTVQSCVCTGRNINCTHTHTISLSHTHTNTIDTRAGESVGKVDHMHILHKCRTHM